MLLLDTSLSKWILYLSELKVSLKVEIGTYTIAICAKMLNKPVYVLCESFKFVRMYPLNQKDLKDEFKYHASTLRKVTDLSSCHPLVDYTNPSLITPLFTDLGILTPSAVSDELIQLYL